MHTVSSFAKINLFLEVTGKRRDGYHDIDSVFCEIDLADTLSAECVPGGGITLSCATPDVPLDEGNLACKAARLLAHERGVGQGLHFVLEKRVPMGSGLGGGSSNAAAALRLANAIWKTELSEDELAALGARVGSDVPFFLAGGLCRVRGRGERVTALPAPWEGMALGLVLPRVHSATAAAYRALRLPGREHARTADAFVAAIEAGDAAGMAQTAFNRFEETVFRDLPEVGAIHRRLAVCLSRPPHLSGTGSALWFFAEGDDVEKAARALPGVPVLATRPVSARER